MKDKIEKIVSELNASIQASESELYDVVQNIPTMVLMMEKTFEELKALVVEYEFPTREEEILFFKETKPKLFSKLIYLRKIYYLEVNRPFSNYTTIRNHLEREHEQINEFCRKNAEFIQYYRSGQTCFDEFYFLRGRYDMNLNLESFYFERDPKFSTNFDFKAAKLIASDMLAAYLNCELSKLKYQEENGGYRHDDDLPILKWTDTKRALAEIVYGVSEVKSVNGGMVERKALATAFGKMFNIDMSDIHHLFTEIKNRKDRTEYLNRLIKALNRRMDDTDSK